jgi:hypothetical protein
MNDQEKIRHTMEEINRLWLAGEYDEIGAFLDEQAVILAPGFEQSICGREAYVQSYRDYDKAAKTHEFSPGEPRIDVIGDVAVAVCPFFVVYELAGRTYRERGHDVLVLSRSGGKWLVAWRTMKAEPSE